MSEEINFYTAGKPCYIQLVYTAWEITTLINVAQKQCIKLIQDLLINQDH